MIWTGRPRSASSPEASRVTGRPTPRGTRHSPFREPH
jgi:hypothetical protein